jgi:hypothetical protein
LSAYGNALSSDTSGNSSYEAGAQVELIYNWSERTHLDATLGESSRVLAGVRSQGTDALVQLTHDFTRGNVSFNYTRSLVPYGIGFLVERQQLTLSGTRSLTPYLDANLALLRVQNNEAAVLLGVDRRSYDSATLTLNWHPTETLTFGTQIAGARTQPPARIAGTVNEWRTALTLTWTPFPRTRSW